MQTHCEADGQGYDACDDNESDKTYSLPPSSSRNIGIVSEVLEFFSVWPSHIPHTVLRRP